MAADGGPIDEIGRLKALLFTSEATRLSQAEAHIRGLEDWVGDAPRLEEATARVLVEALRRAEVARHRELAAAVAPVVVAAIRNEIVNSRDAMVEALYPITGRLVTAAVANAFRELVDSINARLDAALSTARWRMRVKALVSGRSVAEVALAEAGGASLERILLFERGTGRVLAAWSGAGERVDNPELLGGLIAAISDVAATVLADQHGELRTLDLGMSQVRLRASPKVILAAEFAGALGPNASARLDAAFLDFIARREDGATVGVADVAAFARAASGTARPTNPAAKRWRWAAIAAVAAGLAVVALYGPLTRWSKERTVAAAFERARAADARLAPYPLGVAMDWRAGKARLVGLADSPESIAALTSAVALAAAPYGLEPRIAVVARSGEIEAARALSAAATTQIETQLAAARTQAAGVAGALAAVRADLTRADDTAAAARAATDARLRSLESALAALKADAAQASAAADARQTETATRASGLAAAIAGLRADTQGRAESSARDAAALTATLGDLAQRLAAVDARASESLARQSQATHAETEALAAAVAKTSEGLATGLGDVARRVAAAEAELANLTPAPENPRRRLAELARDTAVFFSDRDALANPAAAAAALDALADALKANGEGLRIVGYSDDTGGGSLNADLSRARAAKVAALLAARGIDPSRLVVVARGAAEPIVDSAASDHARNRRVTFEPLYGGETAR